MAGSSHPFYWPITVYYEDTDSGGVVYHSNYLKFFERARTEMLREKVISQLQLLEQNVGFVVRHMDIDFKQGARLDEHLKVLCQVTDIKRASLKFYQELTNDGGDILCKATVVVACIDNKKMKPIAIPAFITSELTQ